MAGENPYQKTESQIREQLEIIDNYNTDPFLISPGSHDERNIEVEKALVGLNKAPVLAKVKSLLSKLPANYSALPELVQIYNDLK